MNEAKEKTALCTSVGADERQSVQNTISSISALDTEINHLDENSPENFEDILRQMQRMSDPAYLHTVSMNELYETVYQSRPPVIDGLLYSGTYLFAGAPNIAQEKQEGKLKKLLKEAKKTISDLKAKIQSLTAELSAVKAELAQYKSVRGKLRAADLEQENSCLRSKIRSYESAIERNDLWHIFNPHRNKTHNRDDAR